MREMSIEHIGIYQVCAVSFEMKPGGTLQVRARHFVRTVDFFQLFFTALQLTNKYG